MACSPATPQPRISTRGGVIVPAAVVSMEKNFGSASAAISTALYPDMVAIEESASMLCARVVRGINSTEKEVTPLPAMVWRVSAAPEVRFGFLVGRHSTPIVQSAPGQQNHEAN